MLATVVALYNKAGFPSFALGEREEYIMRRAIPLVTSTRGALMLVPAYLWAVLGAIMLATCVLVGGWSEPAKAAPPPAQYSITDLGTLGGDLSFAVDINNRGQVVGASDSHAVLWENGKITELGTLGGFGSAAGGINNRGQVVGRSTTIATGEAHAFLWEDGKMTDLGTLPGGDESTAEAINNRGQVVGSSSTTRGDGHAVLWTK
jgi:probable HAF family extracellular repeat protein